MCVGETSPPPASALNIGNIAVRWLCVGFSKMLLRIWEFRATFCSRMFVLLGVFHFEEDFRWFSEDETGFERSAITKWNFLSKLGMICTKINKLWLKFWFSFKLFSRCLLNFHKLGNYSRPTENVTGSSSTRNISPTGPAGVFNSQLTPICWLYEFDSIRWSLSIFMIVCPCSRSLFHLN